MEAAGKGAKKAMQSVHHVQETSGQFALGAVIGILAPRPAWRRGGT